MARFYTWLFPLDLSALPKIPEVWADCMRSNEIEIFTVNISQNKYQSIRCAWTWFVDDQGYSAFEAIRQPVAMVNFTFITEMTWTVSRISGSHMKIIMFRRARQGPIVTSSPIPRILGNGIEAELWEVCWITWLCTFFSPDWSQVSTGTMSEFLHRLRS
jgi:hypothetical protein